MAIKLQGLLSVAIAAVVLYAPFVSAHPQCLDFRPPFISSDTHSLCPDYSEFGCCTDSDHDILVARRDMVRAAMGERWDTCGGYVEDLLCQKCSPYAAHIYDAETSQVPNSFPGLCQEYCHELYDDCKEVVQYIDPSLVTLSEFESRDSFCSYVELPDVDYCYPELLNNSDLNGEIDNVQVTGEGCLCVEKIVEALQNPVGARHAGDGSGKLYILSQIGYISIVHLENRTLLPEPFLNISHRVKITAGRGDERGLLGISFHPNYTNNGRFFVFYSALLGPWEPSDPYGIGRNTDHNVRVSEFRVSRDDPDRAEMTSERVLMEVPQPFANHNGGEILFGDDGYLYISLGDGGAGGDPFNFAQNRSVLLGKMLRIDVDTPNPTLPYSIPADNPFLNDSDFRPEIYAYGLRNIWRCGKDKGDRETGEGKGRIVCGDVGQNAWEELNLLTKGANYGWKAREGFACYDQAQCDKIGPEQLPIHAYNHTVGKSVTGGMFYRGCESPNLNGMYIYADYVRGRMFRLTYNATSAEWNNREMFLCQEDVCFNGLVGAYKPYIMSFVEDQYAEVYFLSTGLRGSQSKDGVLFKIVDPARRGNPEECRHADGGDRVDLGKVTTEQRSTTEAKTAAKQTSTTEAKTAAEQRSTTEAKTATEQRSTTEAKTAAEQRSTTEAKTPQGQKVNGASGLMVSMTTVFLSTSLLCPLLVSRN